MVTAAGVIRAHGYKRGSGSDEKQFCEGSGKAPAFRTSKVPCLWCHGKEPETTTCQHCENGLVPVDRVRSFDSIIVTERVLDEWDGATRDMIAAAVVEQLILYGFLGDPEEAQDWQPPKTHAIGTTDGEQADSMSAQAGLLAALMSFHHVWETNTAGPQKPAIVEEAQKVTSALEKWREVRDAS